MIHKRGTVPVVCCLHAIVVGLGSYAAAFATLMLVFVLLTACSPSPNGDNSPTDSRVSIPLSQSTPNGALLVGSGPGQTRRQFRWAFRIVGPVSPYPVAPMWVATRVIPSSGRRPTAAPETVYSFAIQGLSVLELSEVVYVYSYLDIGGS